MRRLLEWLIVNTPAMNLIMILVIVAGLFSATQLRRETFPEFDIEMIFITVPYPGATPSEIETLICQKVEEAVQSLEGIKKVYSSSNEGSGMIMLELRSDVKNIDRVLNEVRDAVERIPSFPPQIERPIVQRAKMQETIIQIGVLGTGGNDDKSMLELRSVAENLRDELVQRPTISMVTLTGTKDYQIDVEIPEHVLRAYNLSLNDVARTIAAQNVQSPGGTIRAPSQEVNVRTDNRRYDADGIGKLPLITQRDGSVLNLEDIAYIRDEFADGDAFATVYTPDVDGEPNAETGKLPAHPVIALSVWRNTNEDLLKMVDDVKQFVDEKNASGELPEGYRLITWGDQSLEVRGRLNLILSNGLQGFILVFVMLALFLDIKLAFWVSIGIPFSICFASIFMYTQDQTLNMISMFGVFMAIGIIVDDSIVTGENIYAHRKMGKNYIQAAIDGAVEVLPSVTASVMTTMIAFLPLAFVAGIMGKIIFVVPLVIITMLISSLGECFSILPCHLSHKTNLFFRAMHGYFYIIAWVLLPLKFANKYASSAMDYVVEHWYVPSLERVLRWRMVFITAAICILVITVASIQTGTVPYVNMPKMDASMINATLEFPNGTPSEVTDRWTQHLENTFWETIGRLEEERGEKLAVRSFRVVGTSIISRGRGGGSGSGNTGHAGGVQIELVEGSERGITSMEIVNHWRQAVGTIPGADNFNITSQMFGPPGSGIECLLVARTSSDPKQTETAVKQLEAAVEELKEELNTRKGVYDVADSDLPGKWEFKANVKERARSMGITNEKLNETLRAIYYGAESQRLQRGRHEVKLMVCYPREDRKSFSDFNDIRVRVEGKEYPITELADIKVERGYTTITRRNQMRSITVTADIDEYEANAKAIVNNLKGDFLPKLFEKYPAVSIVWEGHEEMEAESNASLGFNFVVAMFAMFILLAFEFRSYFQPFMIMAIIPFGLVGAVIGHLVTGVEFGAMSVFGLIALSGIIVNDSIVLTDFINARIRAGMPIKETLLECGARRFRPIFLTSVTTLGGLAPIILETSFQAKMLIPMAMSLAGGVATALVLVLFLMPVLYSYYIDLLKLFGIDIHRVLEPDIDLPEETAPQPVV